MWDVTKSINHLNSKAQPKTTFWCAKYVREAIAAGGIQLEPVGEARLYGNSLKKGGFSETSITGPPFKAGDVVVIQATSTVAPGHMAMFNGAIWVSDFRQTAAIYPSGSFEREKPRFAIFRYPLSPALLANTSRIAKHRAPIIEFAKRQGVPGVTVDEFFKFIEHGGGQGTGLSTRLGSVLAAADTADNAIKLAQFFFFLRKCGFAIADVAAIFVVVVGMRAPRALTIIDHVLRNGARIQAGLKSTGNVRAGLSLFVTFVQVMNFVEDKEYGQAAAATYRGLMGIGVPWAGAIDSLQSFMPANDANSATLFKVLRACDPIGLGGAGVESFIFGVQSLVDALREKPFDERRLSELVKRLKTGPTAIFAEFGERLPIGEFIYHASQMTSADWKKLGQTKLDELHRKMRGFKRRS